MKRNSVLILRWFLISAVAALVLIPAGTAISGLCPPTVKLTGNEALVKQISEILSTKGIMIKPAKGCPILNTHIESADGKITVTINDAQDRKKRITVDNPAEAATFIESWAISEIGLALIEPPPESPSQTKPESQKQKSEATGFYVGGGPEFMVGLDGEASYWLAGNVNACKIGGPVCIGGLVRYAYDMGINPEAADWDLKRQLLDGMGTLEWPLQFKRFELRPGLGIGFGWMRTEGTAESLLGSSWSRSERFDTWGIIGQAHISLALKVTRNLDIGARLCLRPSLPAHGDGFIRNGWKLPGEPWGWIGAMIFMEFAG